MSVKKRNVAFGEFEDNPISKEYITLGRRGKAEYSERKSVFIAYAAPVKTSSEACDFVKKIKAEYSAARHTAYAYLISSENATRYSDDGEPQGTAGIPILGVIQKGGFTDAVVTVTRYFGGILLGAPGLLRAYTTAASEAVKQAGIVRYASFTEFYVSCSYSDYQKIASELPRLGIREDNTVFEDSVRPSLAVRTDGYEAAKDKINDITSGRAEIEKAGTRFDC